MKRQLTFSIVVACLLAWPMFVFASSNEGFIVNCKNLQISVFYNAAVNYPSKQDASIRNSSKLLYDVMQIASTACERTGIISSNLAFEYDSAETGEEYLTLRITDASGESILYDSKADADLHRQVTSLLRKTLGLSAINESAIWFTSVEDCSACSFKFGAFPSDQSVNYCFSKTKLKKSVKVTRRKMAQIVGIIE